MEININQICYVKPYYKAHNHRYIFQKSSNCILYHREARFYTNFISKVYYSYSDILKDERLYIEDEKVFFFPHAEITTSNNVTQCKFFKTEAELQAFMEENFTGKNWINIK